MTQVKKNKMITSNIYFEEKIIDSKIVTIKPYLYNGLGFKTEITKDDLPEYFIYGNYENVNGYISTKNIYEIVYSPNMRTNNFLGKDSLVLFYYDDTKITINDSKIIEIISAIEKYNNDDLTYLKLKLNYKAKFFNAFHKHDEDFISANKPFEDIKEYKRLFDAVDKLIMALINTLDDSNDDNYLSKAATIVMHSQLSNKLFDPKTKYYMKPTDELFELLKTELM